MSNLTVAGNYVFQYSLSDPTHTVSQQLTVPVYPANTAPVISSATATAATITLPTATTSLAAVTSDPDAAAITPWRPGGDVLTHWWSVQSAPAGASPVFANQGAKNTAVGGLTATGTYVFRLTAIDRTLTATKDVTVTVAPPPSVLTSITLAPTNTAVLTGATKQFTATAKDQFGAAMSPQPTFGWSVSGGGAINGSGLFTAGGTAGGPYTVTATSGGQIATASVTVTPVLVPVTVAANTTSGGSLGRYDIYELTMTESGSYANPWEDVTITAVFTSPSAKSYTVGGFYYDTATWKLRFAPMELGNWTWSLTFDNGAGKFVTGGNFTCTASGNSGFLRMQPGNTRTFITEGDSRPFYANGFNKPAYTGNGGVDAPTFPTFMAPFRAAGINMIRDNAQACHTNATNNYGNNLTVNGFNVGGSGKNNYDTALGKVEDQYYQLLHQSGFKLMLAFMLHPNLIIPNYDVSNPAVKAAAEKYHTYMLNRFSAYVDVWELGNELNSVTQTYLDTVTGICGVKDPYQHPLTISNPQGQLDESGLAVVAPHRYTPDDNLKMADLAASCQRNHATYPDKPLLYGEDGNYTPYGKYDPARYRISIWSAFTNQAGCLFWLVSFDQNSCEAGAGITNQYIGTEERALAKILANFTADFDPSAVPMTATLNPSNQMTGSVLGSAVDIAGYFTHATSHTTPLAGARVTLLIPAAGMQGQWLDPATGNTVQTFTVNSGSQILTLPTFRSDLVLRIRAAGTAPKLEFSTANYNARENQGVLTGTVTRSGSAAGAVSVTYSTRDGQAVAGTSYTAVTGTLSWADGDTAPKTFTVPLLNDNVYDGDRDFALVLSNPAGGAGLGNNADALVTLYNDDSDLVMLNATSYAVMKDAGATAITVHRVGRGVGPVSVNYDTQGGSATTSDYTPIQAGATSVTGVIKWADGDLSPKTVAIPILNNPGSSGNKTFRFELLNPQGVDMGMAYP